MKGYIHAYDFLGSWEQATLVATDTTKGFGLDPSTGWDLWADQAKGFVKSSDAALYTSLVSGGNSYNVYCPDDLGTISIDPDGHSINDKISAWEAVYGNRYITIYGDSPITSAGLTFVGYTTSGGDAYAKYQLWWVSASKNVVIQFAGHLAVSGDGTGYTYGPGKGSASISGGPYHIYLSQLDGQSIGSQDNQIMGADILPPPGTPCISVTKTPSASKVLTGTNVAFTINVTNCGDVPLTMNVTDTYFGTIATNVPIAVDQSIIYTKYAVLTANHANTVDVTATSQSGATVSANATATVDVIHPAISVTKEVNASKIVTGSDVEYTFNVSNTGDVSLTVEVVDDKLGSIWRGTLDAGAYSVTTVTTTLTEDQTNTVTATGTHQLGSVSANATATVDVIHPCISLTKTVNATLVSPGSAVLYTYNVTNCGDTPLTVELVDDKYGTIFTNVVLEPGGYRVDTLEQIIWYDTTNVATATGIDQLYDQVQAIANATVHVPPPTRTLGFWMTHTADTLSVFAPTYYIGCGTCYKTIATPEQLFGLFYASNPYTSTGEKRSSLDQARIILAKQLVTAILNVEAFEGYGDYSDMIDDIIFAYSAYCGKDRDQMLFYADRLDWWNNLGDDVMVPGFPTAPATPDWSKALASTGIAYWDNPCTP
ncbi:MAG: hypothetical protein QHG94_02645 [Candidatus Methanosuratincola sp.]|nr:hypothetical protein [Candidatus Methanosuratincola sp.]